MAVNCILIIISCISALDAVDVIFLLTTPEAPNTRYIFSKGNYSNLIFNPSRQFKILCHGYMESENTTWYLNITAEYMKKGNVNVIATGYQEAASSVIYVPAVKNVPLIAEQIAELIVDLNETKKIPLDNFHLIGHSLGGQVVGATGEKVINSTGLPVARATGLDPAAPGFYLPLLPYNHHNRISADDAKFVDIIHTSILGIPVSVGDADFFPNGGSEQPGCKLDIACNHAASVNLFYYSINKEQFLAHKCENYKTFQKGGCNDTDTALMGDPAQSNSNGSYYLHTDAKFNTGNEDTARSKVLKKINRKMKIVIH